jgi:hypothetical protein
MLGMFAVLPYLKNALLIWQHRSLVVLVISERRDVTHPLSGSNAAIGTGFGSKTSFHIL